MLFHTSCHRKLLCCLCLCVVQRQRLLFACMVWFTFMYFFWKLGDPFPILSPKHGKFASLCFMPSLWLWRPFFCEGSLSAKRYWKATETMMWPFSVCCRLLFRHPVHWAANQSCWSDRSHAHGSVVRVWCGQLSLHVHVLFPQVSSAVVSRSLVICACIRKYVLESRPCLRDMCYHCCDASCFAISDRNVTDSDILALERRLLQTMDMIVSKKKRWETKKHLFCF